MTTQIREPSKLKSLALPVEPLTNDTAKVYTHIHPIILLSLYAYQFPSIVADPVPALTNTLIWTGALQVLYAVICLPPTTGGSASADKKKQGDKKKAARAEGGINGKILPAFLSLIASIVVATPVLFITLVLFGAPISTHHWHTLLCALHVSFLTVLPLVYVHGVDGSIWQEIIAMLRPIDEVYGCMIGTFLGAWMGAVPIPLDWDREWQKWPVTIVTGAYVGFAVGKLAGATVLKGKKIVFE